MKLAIVHTSFALVEPLNSLSSKLLKDVEVVNIVDDTTLAYARKFGVDKSLMRRMIRYFEAAADSGADVILNACSSVGETVNAARLLIDVPIIKIDEPMAERVAEIGGSVAVLATVKSTLEPTCKLLQGKGYQENVELYISQHLCEGAFEQLLAGAVETHDARVVSMINELIIDHDVVVLAQASMARVIPLLVKNISVPVLSSPELALQKIARMLFEENIPADT